RSLTPYRGRPLGRLRKDLPIEGEPSDVHAALEAAHAALAVADYPKLLFVGDPGALVSPAFAERFAASIKNCQVVPLGPGLHYLQEDHAEAIGQSITEWISDIVAKHGPPQE